MASIRIKNIGPLTDTGDVSLGKFNVVIGKQSTGKSTLMKILCFCQWIEKKIMIGEDKTTISAYTHYSRFLKELKQFHRFNDNYFNSQSEIHYIGECIMIDLVGTKNAKITRLPKFETHKHNTKLCFIPSERNLVSAIKNVDRAYKSKDIDIVFNHIFEWGEAKESTSEDSPVDLKIVGDMEYYYDNVKDSDIIHLRKEKRQISPFFASSGVQSVLPIVVMVNYLTESIFSDIVDLSKRGISDLFKQFMSAKRDAEFSYVADQVSKIVNYQNTKIFIEEPEQNLFPSAQQELIMHIASRINYACEQTKLPSSVTMTTHSPYVLTAFNMLIKAAEVATKSSEKVYAVIPQDMTIPISDIRAYYISESGRLTSIIDEELGMIVGNDLDKASDVVEDTVSYFNNIMYGDE